MSTIARSLRITVSRAVLPPTCCLCGAEGATPDLDLCDVCFTLFPVNAPMCTSLHAPLSSASSSSASTLVQVLVPFQYAYPVDHMVRDLKFRGDRANARVLGTLLAHAFRALGQAAPDLIVPIPLHLQRYRERGFNQALELARFAATSLSVPVDARSLVRRVDTREQSSLSVAKRRQNVRGAFQLMRPLRAKRVALIDDVLTTGSTGLAAAQALLDGGVGEVALWAIARVALDQSVRSGGI